MTKILTLKIDQKDVFIKQRKDMFCISLDTILLTNFVHPQPKIKTVIDFGTNNGAIAIFLAIKNHVKITGIEIQTEAAFLAEENVITNQLTNQVNIINTDIKNYAAINQNNKNKKVDAVVCNPPFFSLESQNKIKFDPLKVAARHEIYINLDELVFSASCLLKVKGKFYLIYNAQRLSKLLETLEKYNFAAKKIQFVHPKINKQANVVLVEAVYQAKTGLIIAPPLICHNEDNSYVAQIAKWYNKGK